MFHGTSEQLGLQDSMPDQAQLVKRAYHVLTLYAELFRHSLALNEVIFYSSFFLGLTPCVKSAIIVGLLTYAGCYSRRRAGRAFSRVCLFVCLSAL